MSKYDPLARHLASQNDHRVRLTFSQMQDVLGFELPRSAKLYNAWWSNGDKSHAQAGAWLSVGFETENINLSGGTVDFVRTAHQEVRPEGFDEMAQTEFLGTKQGNAMPIGGQSASPNKQSRRHPAWGALKGLITVSPDVDLTQPTFEDWKSLYGESE